MQSFLHCFESNKNPLNDWAELPSHSEFWVSVDSRANVRELLLLGRSLTSASSSPADISRRTVALACPRFAGNKVTLPPGPSEN